MLTINETEELQNLTNNIVVKQIFVGNWPRCDPFNGCSRELQGKKN